LRAKFSHASHDPSPSSHWDNGWSLRVYISKKGQQIAAQNIQYQRPPQCHSSAAVFATGRYAKCNQLFRSLTDAKFVGPGACCSVCRPSREMHTSVKGGQETEVNDHQQIRNKIIGQDAWQALRLPGFGNEVWLMHCCYWGIRNSQVVVIGHRSCCTAQSRSAVFRCSLFRGAYTCNKASGTKDVAYPSRFRSSHTI
jgi:hypothetical protein